ncbi:nitrile hydratase subunit alpha [Limibacillus halophilus]|uniref:nitrile hydratase n=1 Tax=Limibacillus halophilus TaxID=1579333 RepID=A0A839SSJ8_9PROT|nr:nitrile hydratase subunit alpha [Limibacillus halophilus]MBB3064959.1 nitrile hydratase [Limibacillus halophilus]
MDDHKEREHSHSGHGHGHGHGHDEHDAPHSHLPSDPALRVKALETLLVDKGLVDPAALDALIETYEHKIGPRNGAKVVAKAWCDPDFKAWLLRDATAAIASLGFTGRQGEHMVAVENSAALHNMVVCTLCSCYPWSVLGIPPVWYKSEAYRSRAVIDPRGVLSEFGVTLPETAAVKVWDSTAEVRYLVIPQRPEGTDGLNEEQLAELVTRNSMIGTELLSADSGSEQP